MITNDTTPHAIAADGTELGPPIPFADLPETDEGLYELLIRDQGKYFQVLPPWHKPRSSHFQYARPLAAPTVAQGAEKCVSSHPIAFYSQQSSAQPPAVAPAAEPTQTPETDALWERKPEQHEVYALARKFEKQLSAAQAKIAFLRNESDQLRIEFLKGTDLQAQLNAAQAKLIESETCRARQAQGFSEIHKAAGIPKIYEVESIDLLVKGVADLRAKLAQAEKDAAQWKQLNKNQALRLGAYGIKIADAEIENERLKKLVEASRRLIENKYAPWANAGGIKECKHGYSAGIPCPRCDQETVLKGGDAPCPTITNSLGSNAAAPPCGPAALAAKAAACVVAWEIWQYLQDRCINESELNKADVVDLETILARHLSPPSDLASRIRAAEANGWCAKSLVTGQETPLSELLKGDK